MWAIGIVLILVFIVSMVRFFLVVTQQCGTSRECSGCEGCGYNYVEEETEE